MAQAAVELARDVRPSSVAALINRRLDEHDPWRLALVQRHLVWDEVRMAHLLDSLLAGYPIGSLLVCRVRQGGFVLRESGASRVAEKAAHGTWQLLDGQQRVNALVALFTEHGRFGRFYLDMVRDRIPEEVVTRRRDTRRVLDYIKWVADDVGGGEPIPQRERHIDLSRFRLWAAASADGEILDRAVKLETDPSLVIGLLNEIDPAFTDELSSGEARKAADRASRLLRSWSEPSVPVQYITLDGPSDVLQAFSRINLAGVRLDGEDVFFAAVKTEWPNAEEHLDRVAAASPLLNRMTALRLLARLASRYRSKDDLLPLRVDRLNGDKGRQLISTMERLAADDSPVLARIGVLGRLLTTESKIGYGLRLVDDGLLDHIFAWAAVNPQAGDEGVVRGHLHSIETYVLGAHGFRYPTVFRDGYLRLGFAEAIAAGLSNEPFPIERIVAGVHRRWKGLRRGQNFVLPVTDDDQCRRFGDQNSGLLLSIVQEIPFELPLRDPQDPSRGTRQVEWDHVYPQARAAKMRIRHEKTHYLVHHRDRGLVWEAGNLWALDRPINNKASDGYPSEKFAMLATLPDPVRGLPTPWPAIDPSVITEVERANLLEAERLIRADEVEVGMRHFRAYVVERGLRMYATVLAAYPGIAQFASNAEVAAEGLEDVIAQPLKAVLAFEDLEAVDDESSALETAAPEHDDRFGSVLALADRAGIGSELRQIIVVASDLGLAPRARQSSVMIAPRANRGRMLFTVWPQSSQGGRLSIYRWAQAIAEFFPGVDEEAARATLGPDGYGVLERGDVPAFLSQLRGLLANATQGEGAAGAPLAGDEIRQIAYDWLRATDSDRHGVHYYEIAHAVERQGLVGGKDRMATVLNAMRRALDRFEQVGPGTYTWTTAAGEPKPRSAGVRCWAMRTDQNRRAELWEELRSGRLRQGWGWDPDMDLQLIEERLRAGMDLTDWQRQAWDNRKMLTSQSDGIHVGDLIVVLHMPEHRRFSMARVTAPYQFDGGQLMGDYGHILPVELLTSRQGIDYTDPRLSPRLQSSLGNRPRLWNLDGFRDELESLASGVMPA